MLENGNNNRWKPCCPGKLHRFLLPFSIKFPHLNFAPYVLYIYSCYMKPVHDTNSEPELPVVYLHLPDCKSIRSAFVCIWRSDACAENPAGHILSYAFSAYFSTEEKIFSCKSSVHNNTLPRERGFVGGGGGGQRRPLWPKIGVSSLVTSCHLIWKDEKK